MEEKRERKVYTSEFKLEVVEDMRANHLSAHMAAQKYGIGNKETVKNWERIYLEEGSAGLSVERRGRANAFSGTIKGRKSALSKEVEAGLIAENQYLKAEVAYLKKLQALVLEEQANAKKSKSYKN